jgi:hypothetical protein
MVRKRKPVAAPKLSKALHSWQQKVDFKLSFERILGLLLFERWWKSRVN